jgi:hypothetical protein
MLVGFDNFSAAELKSGTVVCFIGTFEAEYLCYGFIHLFFLRHCDGE